MKIFLGADHRGYLLKEQIKTWLIKDGYDVEDMSSKQLSPEDDYPDYAEAVATQIVQMPEYRGIVFCGSGVGVDIVANKINGARCGYASSVDEIKSARHDDNINILAIASDFTDEGKTKELIKTFLQTSYAPQERYERRLDKIESVEHNKQ
jgi:ribose 5-phosphate isomerase B